MEKQRLKGFNKWVVWGVAFLGLGIMIFFLTCLPFNDGSGVRNAELFGQYGDFIGGVVGTLFALFGFILLYQTLRAQQEALDTQKKDSEKQSFENTFFNLLDAQQNITNQIKVTVPVLTRYKYEGETREYEGRAFFQFAKEELNKLFNALLRNDYPGLYDIRMERVDDANVDNPDPWDMGPFPEEEYERRMNELIKERRMQFALSYYNLHGKRWRLLKDCNPQKQVQIVFYLFFQKYHYAFGHYFRHLYNIIKFVHQYQDTHKQTLMPEARRLFIKETNRYVQFIQAQMSSYELMLLYYNAFCFKRSYELLVRYNFLENLPEEDLVYTWHNFEGPLHLHKRADLVKGI